MGNPVKTLVKLSKVSHKLNVGEFKDSRKLHPGESKWTLVALYKILPLVIDDADEIIVPMNYRNFTRQLKVEILQISSYFVVFEN